VHRIAIVASVLAILLMGLFAAGRTARTAAQDGTPAAMAGHPLVGAWLLDADTDDPENPPALVVFSSDGVYTQADYDGSVGVGSWEPTGPTSGALTFFQQFPNEDEDFGGSTVVRATIEATDDGETFTASYTLEFVEPDGASDGEIGPGTATATRIAVEPMGTPVASFDEAFAEPEAGTPTS